MGVMHQYEVVGRHKPTKLDPSPKVYRMKLFAMNSVIARSRFWYYLSKLKKVKKANGELLEIHEIFERKDGVVRNYGMWIRYDSRSGTHNIYKEYRDVSLCAAVDKMYSEMASRHRARRAYIQIIKTAVVAAGDLRRENTKQFAKSDLKFRMMNRMCRPSQPRYRKTFSAKAPNSFF